METQPQAVVVKDLVFAFPLSRTIIHDFSMVLPAGSRCLLCGANGAGKFFWEQCEQWFPLTS